MAAIQTNKNIHLPMGLKIVDDLICYDFQINNTTSGYSWNG
jgi:hypothetical protein